jgi:hypothetical protein
MKAQPMSAFPDVQADGAHAVHAGHIWCVRFGEMRYDMLEFTDPRLSRMIEGTTDIALRDYGLLVGALTLSRLSAAFAR